MESNLKLRQTIRRLPRPPPNPSEASIFRLEYKAECLKKMDVFCLRVGADGQSKSGAAWCPMTLSFRCLAPL